MLVVHEIYSFSERREFCKRRRALVSRSKHNRRVNSADDVRRINARAQHPT